MASTLVKFTLRVTLPAGAVYVTAKEGIWGDSQESIAACSRLQKVLPPDVNEATGTIVNQIPSREQVHRSFRDYWNTGVEHTFSGLLTYPPLLVASAYDYAKMGMEMLLAEGPKPSN